MNYLHISSLALACGLAMNQPGLAAPQAGSARASAFCQSMQSTIQPFVKVPLALSRTEMAGRGAR
jgi:hypothetical protein